MKRCKNCNEKFDDSAVFCPICGGKLEEARAASGRKKRSGEKLRKNSYYSNLTDSAKEFDNSSNIVVRWLAVVLSIVGLIIAWEWSIALGFGLAVAGIICGCASKNKINKWVSVVVGIIVCVICVICMFI